MKKKNNNIELNNNEEKELSFLEKIRTDKKYSAKVQLIGYGVFIVILVVYLNIASMGNTNYRGNSIGNKILSGNNGVNEVEDDSLNLLEQLKDNYKFDTMVRVFLKDQETGKRVDEEKKVRYSGKSYGKEIEIIKESTDGNSVYHKVDERYYTKSEDKLKLLEEEQVYELVSGEYIEINSILKLLEQSSLDHVTDYSTGKKEYVYYLKVKDIVITADKEEKVEIFVTIENNIITIKTDYTKLLSLIYENISECHLEMTISDIGKVEEFSVLPQEKLEEESFVTE